MIFPSQESNNTLAKYTFLSSGLLCSPALPNKVQQGFSFVGCCQQKANSLAFFSGALHCLVGNTVCQDSKMIVIWDV